LLFLFDYKSTPNDRDKNAKVKIAGSTVKNGTFDKKGKKKYFCGVAQAEVSYGKYHHHT